MRDRAQLARRKLLHCLDRVTLEKMCVEDSPWHMNRTDIIAVISEDWNEEKSSALEAAIGKLIEAAR